MNLRVKSMHGCLCISGLFTNMVIVIEASRANILPTEDKIFLIRNFLMKHDARKWGLFTAVIFKAFKKGNSMSFQFMVSPSRTQYSF